MLLPILVESIYDDTYYNLALEEYLFSVVQPNEIILYIYKNDKSIVLGQNQNTWESCNINNLRKDSIAIARRLSNGESDYQDLGCLNFTFITHNSNFNNEKQMKMIINALKSINLNVDKSNENELLINNRRFSNQDYYFNNNKAYHHCTLKINSDLENINCYMKSQCSKLDNKIYNTLNTTNYINVCDVNKDITIYKVSNALKKYFENTYGIINRYKIFDYYDHDIQSLRSKYSSHEWIYKNSLIFDIA